MDDNDLTYFRGYNLSSGMSTLFNRCEPGNESNIFIVQLGVTLETSKIVIILWGNEYTNNFANIIP